MFITVIFPLLPKCMDGFNKFYLRRMLLKLNVLIRIHSMERSEMVWT